MLLNIIFWSKYYYLTIVKIIASPCASPIGERSVSLTEKVCKNEGPGDGTKKTGQAMARRQ